MTVGVLICVSDDAQTRDRVHVFLRLRLHASLVLYHSCALPFANGHFSFSFQQRSAEATFASQTVQGGRYQGEETSQENHPRALSGREIRW